MTEPGPQDALKNNFWALLGPKKWWWTSKFTYKNGYGLQRRWSQAEKLIFAGLQTSNRESSKWMFVFWGVEVRIFFLIFWLFAVLQHISMDLPNWTAFQREFRLWDFPKRKSRGFWFMIFKTHWPLSILLCLRLCFFVVLLVHRLFCKMLHSYHGKWLMKTFYFEIGWLTKRKQWNTSLPSGSHI